VNRAGLRDGVVLLLAASVLYLAFLGARDLWNPNEPIYGQAVAEMYQRGDPLIPTVNGEVFREKPPLYFWLALAGAAATGGAGEFVLRLPSALAGIASVAMIYLLVLPAGGRLRARIAAALFATTYIVFWSSRSVQMDLLLTAFVLASVLAAVAVLDRGLNPRIGWLLVGAAIGLGFLTKGPIAVVGSGLPILLYAWTTGRLRSLWTPKILWGLGAVVVVVAPWVAWLGARWELETFKEIVWRQTFVRSLDPWDHAAPWWYFLREFWGDMAPWSLFLPLAVALPQRDSEARRLDRLGWLWLLGFVAVLSFSASKRSPYILPIAPAVAILVSGLVERRLRGLLEGWRNVAVTALLALIGIVLAAAGVVAWVRVVPEFPEIGLAGRVIAAGLVTWGCGTLLLLALRGGRRRAAPALFLASLVIFYMLAAGWVLPAANVYKSPREFCERVDASVGPSGTLRAYRIWKWRAGYSYYLGRPIARLLDEEALLAAWRDVPDLFVIVERGRVDEFQTIVGAVDPLFFRAVGSNAVYLFSNRPPG